MDFDLPAEVIKDPTSLEFAAADARAERAAGRQAARQRAVGAATRIAGLGSIITAADQLDAGRLWDPVRACLDRIDGLELQLQQYRADVERQRAAAIRGLAAGEVSVADAAAVPRDEREHHRLVEHAAAGLRREASKAAHAAAAATFDAASDAVGALVGESVKLAKGLPGHVTDDLEALRAGGKVADVWQRLAALYDRWGAWHGLLVDLRREGLLPQVKVGKVVRKARESDLVGEPPPMWRLLRFAAPDRIPEGYTRMAKSRRLADAAAAGAKPGVVSAADAERRLAAWLAGRLDGGKVRRSLLRRGRQTEAAAPAVV